MEGDVDGVVAACAGAAIVELPGAREKLAVVFMEGDGHDAGGLVEGEFDAVAVVDVNVDVEYAGMPSVRASVSMVLGRNGIETHRSSSRIATTMSFT